MPVRAGLPFIAGNQPFSQQKVQVEGFVDPAGKDWIVMNDTAGAVNALMVQNAVSGEPVVLTVDGLSHDVNADLLIIAPGTGTITIGQAGNTVAIAGSSISTTGAGIFISNAAAALAVGPTGSTNPVFRVDASGSAVTGLLVHGHVAGGGYDVSIIGGNALENLRIDAKGGGALSLNATATGAVHIGHGVIIAGFGAFAAGDKYVIADASGNVHLSALGPAS